MANNFWNIASVEPKRSFKFLLYFNGMPQFVAKSVTKPNFQITTTPHNFLQHQFNFPGKVTWQPINITIVDPIQPDSAQSLYNIIKNAGYVTPPNVASDGDSGKRTLSKEGMVSQLGNRIQIDQIGPGGAQDVKERWHLNNPLITSVTFGDLSYENDSILNITIGITYDWADLNDGGLPVNPTPWASSTAVGGSTLT
jgi:hypothetical protein